MSKRRVLIVSNHASIVGGGEISLLTLVKGLCATDWQPLVAVPGPGAVADGCARLGVDVHEVPLPTMRRPGIGLLAAARKMRKLVASTRPRLVHANGSRAMFYAGLGTRRARCPAIWHIRILDPDPALDPLLVRLASASIAISTAVRNRLARWPNAYARCRVIPNGVDLEAFAAIANRTQVRQGFGFTDNELVVVCVSRLVDFKRHDLLLEAMQRLGSHYPQLRCLIVGDGPEEAALRQIVTDRGLRSSVSFAGHREDIADILAASDIFVLPSPAEHFGRVVIEAMAMSVPVVAANAAGPAEIIMHGESGLLVEPASSDQLAAAIDKLCQDRNLRERLGTAAHRRVEEHYSMQRHVQQVTRAYGEILGEATSE